MTGVPARYGETDARAWLTWLARGMLRHGQTVFLLEQLQPSWLGDEDRRRYVFASRLAWGLMLGLSFWLILTVVLGLDVSSTFAAAVPSGIVAGLIAAVLTLVQYRRDTAPASAETAVRQAIKRSLAVLMPLCGLTTLFISVALHALGRTEHLPVGLHPAVGHLIIGASGGVFFGFLLGIGGTRLSADRDIRTLETWSWSWSHARFGALKGVLGGAFFGFALGLQAPTWWPSTVAIGLTGALIGAGFDGLRGSVVEMKIGPNQGIVLTAKHALLLGSLMGALLSLGFYLAGIDGAVLAGLGVGTMAVIWYGGTTVVQHYILRWFISRHGKLPLALAPFLDYAAAELRLLQKVGGGYMFIHRFLLEHFASDGDAEVT